MPRETRSKGHCGNSYQLAIYSVIDRRYGLHVAILRSALLICATLGNVSFALPAPSRWPLNPVIVASLPDSVPDLLDPTAKLFRAGPDAVAPDTGQTQGRRNKPTATTDLVAQFADRTGTEVECSPSASISKPGEPTAGQLAVGHVIANRAKSAAVSRRHIAACCSTPVLVRPRSFIRRCRARRSNAIGVAMPRSSTRI
jgi:hypothetical protein